MGRVVKTADGGWSPPGVGAGPVVVCVPASPADKFADRAGTEAVLGQNICCGLATGEGSSPPPLEASG